MNLTNLGDADAFKVSRNEQGDRTIFHFKSDPKQLAVGLSMPHEMAANLAERILQHLSTLPDKGVQNLVQIVGIRDISAQTPHPNLLSLKYDLECGLQLETSIDLDDARRLRQQLDSAIRAVEAQPPPIKQ